MIRFAGIIIVALIFVLAGAGYIILARPFSTGAPPSEAPPVGALHSQNTTPTKPPPPPKESTMPAEPQAPSPEDKTEALWQAIADVSTTGESQELILVFTEAEVNEQAAKMLFQVEIPEDIPLEIEDVHIDLKPNNNLLTEAQTTILGLGVKLKASSQVSISEGKPDVTITDVSFGFIPIPGTVKDKIVAFITQKTDDVLVQLTESAAGSGIDAELKDINMEEEKVTITVLIENVAE